jgi:predicted Zn-dependent protease
VYKLFSAKERYLFLSVGVAMNNLGRAEETIPIVKQTLESQPRSAAHWVVLGQAQLQLGQVEEAEKSLRTALQMGAQTKSVYFSLFNVCMRLGKREEALAFREKYTAFGEEKQLSAQERYQVLSEAEARRVCVSVYAEAAALYMAIPDLQSSEHLLLRVLTLEPNNQAACRELIRIYAEQASSANELLVRERLVELDPLDLMNYLELAKAYDKAGLPRDAEAAIKLGISMAPQSVIGFSVMTDFLLEQNQPARAQWYVEQALALKPSQQGFQLLAKTLRAQGKAQAANEAEKMARDLEQLPR